MFGQTFEFKMKKNAAVRQVVDGRPESAVGLELATA
jgi:hypothetical protein